MGLISRIYNFVAGTPAVADQVDAEFDQILSVLNGNIDPANLSASSKNTFLKLAVATDRKIAVGTGTIVFPGGSGSSNAVTVAHGLGTTPTGVWPMGVIDGGWRVTSKDATNFTADLQHYSGSVAGSYAFWWIAVT